MRRAQRNAAHLWDMLEAARRASELSRGVRVVDLTGDFRTRLALERALEIIGEAARRVTPAFRARHPGIPWKGIIGFRNVLAHEYGDIDYRRLLAIARKDLPKLIAALEGLLDEFVG